MKSFEEYSKEVTNILETKTDFYTQLDKVATMYDFDSETLLVAANVLVEKAYISDIPTDLAADAIYTGFITASLSVLGSFKLEKNKIN